MGIVVDALKRWVGFGLVQVEEKDNDMVYVSVDLVNECYCNREKVERLETENKELRDYIKELENRCDGLEQSLDASRQQVEYLNTQLNDEIPEIDKIESKPWSEL